MIQRLTLLICLVFVVNSLKSQVNLSNGLMAYYPFSGNANDASGNNNNPVFNNTSLTSDRLGNPNSACNFNGISNYIKVPNSATLNMGNTITIAAWIKPMGFYNGSCHGNSPIMKGDTDFQPGNYELRFDDHLYQNGQNCSMPLDIAHQNFRSGGTPTAPYSPYINTNQWYAVVFTNDGVNTRLYVNCQLVSTGTASGNYANSYDLFMGKMNNPSFPYWFNGVIDEVRIYNRALNVDEVNVYSGCSLSSDSIINTYTPALSFDPCKNIVEVGSSNSYYVGDTVLLIQMKGAYIDSSNTSSFGEITNLRNAGNYEYNYVKSINGNNIELKNNLLRTYDFFDGKVQLIRVPFFQNLNTTNRRLTCQSWNGLTGGVLVFNVADTLKLGENIDVSGRGFRGGNAVNSQSNVWQPGCSNTTYFTPSFPNTMQEKGESIAEISISKRSGRGKLASGGGGGNTSNCGGGGGGNGGTGGLGGRQYGGCNDNNNPFNGGIGGLSQNANLLSGRIFLGSGGGAGDANDPIGSSSFNPKGGNGGGIVLISASVYQSNGFSIFAKGDSGLYCASNCNEGMGGGGAGGSIFLRTNTIVSSANPIYLTGGKGANNTYVNGSDHGPGGGGGGGAFFTNASIIPANVNLNLSGGVSGMTNTGLPYGAQPGSVGLFVTSRNLPFSTIPFKKTIDSIRYNLISQNCGNLTFSAITFTSNASALFSWFWQFGDGGTSTAQNPTHTYTNSGNYHISLVVTDQYGCKDSTQSFIQVNTCIDSTINIYTPVYNYNPCKNEIVVQNSTGYNVGDTIVIMQMKGAVVDSTNTAAFGNILDYRNTGNYEYNFIRSINGNSISLKNILLRNYDFGTAPVQLIRVPFFQTLNTNNRITCPEWDGEKGGVIVINVADTFHVKSTVHATGKGFRGGTTQNTMVNTFTCGNTDYFYPQNNPIAAGKGESIADLSNQRNAGKGRKASAGGGGVDPNTGGGGGGNGNMGGNGGYGYNDCIGYSTANNWGLGGNPLSYSNANNRVFLGGAGGAGHCNNGFSDPTVNTNMNGGNGGGIIIISAGVIKSYGAAIESIGNTAYELTAPGYLAHDGMGGGGAGGTILINSNNIISPLNVSTKGGRGANMSSSPSGGRVGPGGGGAGGVLWYSGLSMPTSLTYTATGGANGVITQNSNDPYGATPGLPGISLANLTLPISNTLFTPNIDSVNITTAQTSCNGYSFTAVPHTNISPITSWQWQFGDGNTATTSTASHTYTTPGTYSVTLVGTDANGCKDSATTIVAAATLAMTASNDTTVCLSAGANATFNLSVSSPQSGVSYTWTPAAGLNNPNSPNPTATVSNTTTLFVDGTNGFCSGRDSVKITILQTPVVQTIRDSSICIGSSLILTTTGASTYQWSTQSPVSNHNISNPAFNGTASSQVIVTGTAANGCVASDTALITVNPLPIVKSIPDTTICGNTSISLTTTGAASYSWSPAVLLTGANTSAPVYNSASGSQTFYVTGTNANGCVGKDTVRITVKQRPVFNAPQNSIICFGDSVQLNSNNDPSLTYNWQPSAFLNNNSISNPIATPPTSQVYTVTISEPACNYSTNFPVTVTVNALPKVNARKSNDITCGFGTSILTATGAQNYHWTSSGPFLSSSSNAVVTVAPGSNTIYTVFATDSNHCENSASVMVNVNPNGGGFYLPNSFTPNKDGLNDCFGIMRWGIVKNLKFSIYNRWGERVFYTTNSQECWDGTYKNKRADMATYVYYIEGEAFCGKIVKKGNVILIR